MHLTFLRTPAALTGADISWWLHAGTALPLLLSSLILLYSYILIFSNSFLSAFFISAARRKRGAQINKKNNETHKKKEYKIKKFDKKIEAATRKLSSSGRERKWMRGEKERGW